MAMHADVSAVESMLALIRKQGPAIRSIVEQHGGSNPRLFGSVARGDETPESDFDILVDPKPRLSLFGLVRIERELTELLGRPVDVIPADSVPSRAHGRVFGDAIAL